MKKLLIALTLIPLIGCNWFDNPTAPSKQAVITLFSADTNVISLNQSVTLRWDVQGSTVCRIDPNIGNVPTVGFIIVSPTVTTTYVLTCSNDGNNPANRQLTITVK